MEQDADFDCLHCRYVCVSGPRSAWGIAAPIQDGYFWLPDFLVPALSTFYWVSWIAPNNGPLNNTVGFLCSIRRQ